MKMLLKSVICGIREQCTGALFIVDLSTITGWTKKKKRKKRRRENVWNAKRRRGRGIQTHTRYQRNCGFFLLALILIFQ